jgi:hypothetical protein
MKSAQVKLASRSSAVPPQSGLFFPAPENRYRSADTRSRDIASIDQTPDDSIGRITINFELRNTPRWRVSFVLYRRYGLAKLLVVL